MTDRGVICHICGEVREAVYHCWSCGALFCTECGDQVEQICNECQIEDIDN